MNETNYISNYQTFATKLANDYTMQVMRSVEKHSQKKLWSLELAMHRMDNELNGRMADILGQAECFTMVDVEKLEWKLADVKKAALKELLFRNLEVMNKNKHKEKATVSR
jgi:hypothetical protein